MSNWTSAPFWTATDKALSIPVMFLWSSMRELTWSNFKGPSWTSRTSGQREFRAHDIGDDPLRDIGCEPRHGPAQMLGHGKVHGRALQGPAHGPLVLAPEGPAMLAVIGRPVLGNDKGSPQRSAQCTAGIAASAATWR